VDPSSTQLRDRIASVLTALLVHGTMAAGFAFGVWDAGASVVGVLLDSLVAYALWLAVYLRLRPPQDGRNEVLIKTFIGLSFGVWGFIGMFRAITLKDTAFLAINAAVLEGLGSIGDAGDGAVVILVIVAAVLLIASLFFLGKILIGMAVLDLVWIAAGVAVFRIGEIARYVKRHADSTKEEKVEDAEDHLAELCLHVFVKGWAGAIIMFFLVGLSFELLWVYLAWSFLHDVVVRPLLWNKVGGGVKRKVLARKATRVHDREHAAHAAQAAAAR
jgi:hypothetical protein